MPFAFTPGLWLFILAAIIIVGLMGVTWQFRATHTGRAFLLLVTCALIWVIGFSFETAVSTLEGKILFANLQFTGLCFIPNAWLYLACSYREITRPARDWILLAALPAFTNLLIWTNPLHHWFRGVPALDTASAPFPVLVNDYQFWFYFVHAPSGYLYILAAILILTRGIRKSQTVYRGQTLLLLAALFLPLLTDLHYVLGFSFIPYYNLTPAIFSVSAALIAWALFRFQFLDLRPVARDRIIENLQEGIIVLDHKNRIVDFNLAAKRIAKLTAGAIGKDPQDMEEKLLEELSSLSAKGKSWTEVKVGENPALYYELRFSELKDPAGRPMGRIVTLRDSTERAELFHKIQYAATHDELTNALNRQQFSALAEYELQRRSPETRRPVSVLMFDLDGFKHVNDQFGHAMGDKALVLVARKCQQLLRPTDILGRIGGDEFAVFLADTDTKNAHQAAERLRKGIESIKLSALEVEIKLTGSFGIHSTANRAESLNEILERADQAMYRAKQQGGNRIVRFTTLADTLPQGDNRRHGKND